MKVLELLKHPAFNKAFFAELLYGDRSTKNTSKLTLKIQGKRKWKTEELEKLELFFKEFRQVI